MSERSAGTWALPALLALFAAVFAIQVDQAEPPVALGSDAKAARFSAERARRELTHLLGDETPHPVGTPANRAVRDRLLARLGALGVPAEVQATTGCAAEHATCARVENVIGEIAGESEQAVALMAHYDSVAPAPGAGDDGAAVAAILEIARIAAPGAPYRNSILLVFTDAEEMGLLGAEAFFAEHPSAKRVRAVLNLEGSGSSGPVFLLRSAPQSGHLLDVFRAVAPAPFAQSVTEEVFRRMPNDTDFSVSQRAGVPGIDFAFAGERNHYHTPLDTIANLDLGTLQHHGENALPLLRGLLDADLGVQQPSYVYANLGKRLWLHWPPPAGLLMALAAVALLAAATWRTGPRPLRLMGAIGAALAIVVISAALTFGALIGVDRLAGARPAWPADPWPWRLVVYAVPVLVLASAGPWLARRLGGRTVYLGAWWVFAVLAVALAALLPLAAYLLVPAALVAALLVLIAALRVPGPGGSVAAIAVAAALLPAWFFLPTAWSMENTQGLGLAAAMAGPLALLAMVSMPAATNDPGRITTLGAAGTVVLSFVMASLVEPYSAWRPQHLNVAWLQEAGAERASIVVTSPDPLPSRIEGVVTLERTRPYPWDTDEAHVAGAQAVAAAAPRIEHLEAAEGFERYRIVPVPGALATTLWIPAGRIEDTVRIDGRETTTAPRPGRNPSGYRRLSYVAAPPDGFVVAVKPTAGGAVTAYLVDVRPGVPPVAARVAAARGDLAVPVHSGDLTLVYREIQM